MAHRSRGARNALRPRPAPIAHIIAALGVTAVMAGCSEITDAPAAPAAQVVRAVATDASIFSPGVISDHRWQYRITFTPNGKTAYYTVANGFFPGTRQSSIHVSHLQGDGSWGTPQVAPFSGTYTDIDPFISPDGQRLYFSSIRPLDGAPKPDLDIFYMERTPGGWGEPIRLDPEINTAQDELYASADAAGTLYFASGPFGPTPEADWNIYSARTSGDGFAPREPVTAVNTRLPWNPADPTWDWEFNPEISVDGRTLIFASLRPGGYGFGDLYVSNYHQGEWSTPVNLGPAVNTAADEFHPTLSRDGRTLYFARTIFSPAFVPSDFYSVPTAALDGFRR
jgi:Tol biopolymer transport system component